MNEQEIKDVNIKFINKSGNRRRQRNATLTVSEDHFSINYVLSKMEKGTNEEGQVVMVKREKTFEEVGVFNEVVKITNAIPFFSLIYNVAILVVILFLLLTVRPVLYIQLFGYFAVAFCLFDLGISIYTATKSYIVQFNNQIAYELIFANPEIGRQFKQLVASKIATIIPDSETPDDEA